MKRDTIRRKGLTLKRGRQSVIQIPEIGRLYLGVFPKLFSASR